MWRRKPPGDIAQAVIELMEDTALWRAGLCQVKHARSDLVVSHTGFFIAASVGAASYRFEGRDYRAVDKAWRRLKKRMARLKQAEAAERLRRAMALPGSPEPVLTLPPETLEQVEARVRRLRAAVLQASG